MAGLHARHRRGKGQGEAPGMGDMSEQFLHSLSVGSFRMDPAKKGRPAVSTT